MTPNVRTLLSPILLTLLIPNTGCGSGSWEVEIWGEDYIETGIPSASFADGCSATFDQFLLSVAAVEASNGEQGTGHDGPFSFDLVQPGPQSLTSLIELPSGYYDTVSFRVAPPSGGKDSLSAALSEAAASIHSVGTLTCPSDSVTFDWAFATDTTYVCEPDGLNIPKGGSDTTQLTIHGDHFFYNGLEDPDAAVLGEAIVAADADGDGAVSLAELDGVPVASLGYTVGSHAEVSTLASFLEVLASSLGHIDGEGHCVATAN
jgi:hypothetical protein